LYWAVSDRIFEKKIVTKMISIAKNGDETTFIRSCYNLHLYEGPTELLLQKEKDLGLI